MQVELDRDDVEVLDMVPAEHVEAKHSTDRARAHATLEVTGICDVVAVHGEDRVRRAETGSVGGTAQATSMTPMPRS